MKPLAPASFLALALVFIALPAAALGALDGKVFMSQVGGKAKGAETAQPDKLEFADGKFRAAFCSALGYGDARYTASSQNNAIKFETVAVNKTGGKMKCSGMVLGQDIEGVCAATESGKIKESWFKGRLK